jgi:hypothetical protein
VVNESKVLVKTIPLPFGKVRYEFEITDGFPVILGRMVSQYTDRPPKQIGDVFTIGQYRLRVVDVRHDLRLFVCMPDNLRGVLHQIAYQFLHIFDDVYRRTILTLYVWGLADFDEFRYSPPSWRDIKVIKRFNRWMYGGSDVTSH